jgi:guanylate kinase
VTELAGLTFPLVLAAPSGAGKTTIARELRERRGDIVFSVSATTRAPRPGERDGVDYHFVDVPEFRRMIAAGELIEWAEVHGNLYGTPLRNVHDAVARREYLLLDIDVQGARQLREKLPEAVFVFVLPPSGGVLSERLAGRGSEDAAVRRRRLANARDEIREAAYFDYAIVNDDLAQAVGEVERILLAETRRVSRIPGLEAGIARMCGEIDGYLGESRGQHG